MARNNPPPNISLDNQDAILKTTYQNERHPAHYHAVHHSNVHDCQIVSDGNVGSEKVVDVARVRGCSHKSDRASLLYYRKYNVNF